MNKTSKRDPRPPVVVYRVLRQVEELITSAEEAGSPRATYPVASQPPDPESLLWRKRRFLHTMLVRKRWEHLPDAYFASLMRVAIYEHDPSLNRDFLEPALRAFGYQRVQAALLVYLEQGTLREQAGAARACYWAWFPIVIEPRPGYEEFRRGCDAELWRRKDLLLLKTFVEQEDLEVRQAIISQLSLNPSDYPEASRPLIPTAVQIAGSHPDASIRRKVEILLQRQSLDP